jgi:excisionase family DNA binding protein
MEKLLRVDKVAEILDVSKKTVFRYIKSGKLKATKIGQWRIDGKDLNDFINKNKN